MEKSTFEALVAPLMQPQNVSAAEWCALLQSFEADGKGLLFEDRHPVVREMAS